MSNHNLDQYIRQTIQIFCNDNGLWDYLFEEKNLQPIPNFKNYRVLYLKEVQELLGPIFKQWHERVTNLMYQNVYRKNENTDYESCTDFVFLERYRIKKSSGINPPKLYIKKNEKWTRIVNASHQDWPFKFNIRNVEFYNENVYLNNSILKIASAVALSELFNNDEILRHKNIFMGGLYYRNEGLQEFSEIEKIAVISQIFINIVEFNANQDYKNNILRRGINLEFNANPFYIKPFTVGKALKNIRRIIAHCLDPFTTKLCLMQQDSVSLMSYEMFISTYRTCMPQLQRWHDENPIKLMYLLRTNTTVEEIKDSSFFSYAHLASIEHQRPFSFLDKQSLQKTLFSNKTIIRAMFPSNTQYSDRMNDSYFKLWTYWLGHTRHKKINTYVFLALKSLNIHVRFKPNNPEHIKSLPKVIIALDLIYEYLMGVWKENPKKAIFLHNVYRYAELHEIYDFLFSETSNEEEKQVVYSFHFTRLQPITTKSTLPSLIRRSQQWHLEINQRKEYEEYNYTHLLPNQIVMNEVTFTPIISNAQLVKEGAIMHHCVATYHRYIRKLEYVVFTVQSESERATLGIDVYDPKNPKFEYSQCYKACNAPISRKLKKVVNGFISHLNANPTLIFNSDYQVLVA